MTDDQKIAARVASRFVDGSVRRDASTQLPSAPALALLTKAAKGIKGGFTIEALEEAVVALGWSMRTHPIGAPITGEQFGNILHRATGLPTKEWTGGSTKNDPLFRYCATREEAEDLLEKVKPHVENVTSPPANPKVGTLYAHNLRRLEREETSRPMVGMDHAWLGMQGWTLTTPKGDATFTNKLTYTGKLEEFKDAAPEKVWTHLYKSGLKEAAKALLASFGGEEVVQRVLKPVDPRKLLGTGTCPCCFMNVKLVRSTTKIMRHGWQVEGQRQRGALYQSWHSGPCFGAGYTPFELSAEGTKDFLEKAVKPGLTGAKETLARLKSRPDTIRISTGRGLNDFEDIPRDTTEKRYTSKGYVSKYDYHLEQKIMEAETRVDQIKAMIEDLTRRIAAWKPQPLPG